jgi:hypothetical protein
MTAFSAQELLQRHGIPYVETRKGKYVATCPECGGSYCNVEIKRDGVVWHCKSCDQGGGEKFDQGARPDGDGGSQLGPIKATYDYVDERGERLFQVLRFEPLHGPKQFRQRKSPDQKKWSIKGVRLVPFRLPQLIEAVAKGETVYIPEGEKDVLSLEKYGLVATCNAMGAGKWLPEFSEFFKGAPDVVIIPDNDDPGREHARSIARSLFPVARAVRVLDLAAHWREIEASDDVSDWFEAGHDVDELEELASRIEPLEQPPAETNGKTNGQHGPNDGEPPGKNILSTVTTRRAATTRPRGIRSGSTNAPRIEIGQSRT